MNKQELLYDLVEEYLKEDDYNTFYKDSEIDYINDLGSAVEVRIKNYYDGSTEIIEHINLMLFLYSKLKK